MKPTNVSILIRETRNKRRALTRIWLNWQTWWRPAISARAYPILYCGTVLFLEFATTKQGGDFCKSESSTSRSALTYARAPRLQQLNFTQWEKPKRYAKYQRPNQNPKSGFQGASSATRTTSSKRNRARRGGGNAMTVERKTTGKDPRCAQCQRLTQ